MLARIASNGARTIIVETTNATSDRAGSVSSLRKFRCSAFSVADLEYQLSLEVA
jgi:hypothetical protein